MEKKIGFAIVGTGSIAHIHAQAIKSLDDANLVGVFSKTKARAVAFGEQYGCMVAESLEELLKNTDLDVVCICTPSGAHEEVALHALEAGKHCLVEKPLEVRLEKSDRIIQKAKEKKLHLAVVYPTRFYPVSKTIKQAINDGRFGNLVLGSAYVKWSRDPAYYASADWRGTWELDGGGALMNQGIHSVDLLQWYMGPVQSVQALMGNRKHVNIEVEDTVVAILKFKNGALGTLECTTAAYPGSLKRIEIVGSEGTVVLEENSLLTWDFKEETHDDKKIRAQFGEKSEHGGVADPMDISYYGHQQQIIEFIDTLKRSRACSIDGNEGRKSVEIVCAIYESARTGKEVFI